MGYRDASAGLKEVMLVRYGLSTTPVALMEF